MTASEAGLMNSNARKFSSSWWLSDADSIGNHHYVLGSSGHFYSNGGDSLTLAVRPVITVPSGAVITGGEGTSEEPYEITVP